jgi:hypothetical protein
MKKAHDWRCQISVDRSDLKIEGYDVSKVDDATMSRLARKMAEEYIENVFWIDLPITADSLGIPRTPDEDDSALP